MTESRTAWDRVSEGEISAPALRSDPEIRKRMSRPALSGFFNIAKRWGLAAEEERALLGWPARSTFHKWKRGESGSLPYDTLIRISLVLGIFKALHLLYPSRTFADGWVRMPNSNTLFRDRSPLDLMIGSDIDALYSVRRLLDGRRGAWS